MSPDTRQLIDTVQRNCHISDARHAGNYTLCVYLLKMREFYRWEQAHDFGDELSTDDIGQWLNQREALWDSLENEDYAPLAIDGQHFDPFESADINRQLLQQGMVYSGGIGVKSKPHFFIGELEHEQRINGYHILVSAREFARDLTSPPAMSQGNTIYMRRESFKRMIWERTEEWRWNKPDNAMARAIACYDFDSNVEAALDAMTDNELQAAMLHEIGEIQAGEILPGWGEMMQAISFSQAEIMARACRDHLADMLSTLPALLEHNNEASIHFYFANLTSMRKLIFPLLEQAYRQWLQSGDTDALQHAVELGQPHWQNLGEQMLALHSQSDSQSLSENIQSLIEQNHL